MSTTLIIQGAKKRDHFEGLQLVYVMTHQNVNVSSFGAILPVFAWFIYIFFCTSSARYTVKQYYCEYNNLPVSTEVSDRIRVQFPVRDIYLGMWPATHVNSA